MLRRSARRYLLVSPVVAAILAAFALAAGAAPEVDSAAISADRPKGRFCTKSSCTGSEGIPWGQAAGFGAAVVATGLLARRRE